MPVMEYSIMNNKGFSLVELLVVIAIMGVMLSLAVLGFNSMQVKSQIESQTRVLFADLNQARIDSQYLKLRHSIVMQPNSYTYKVYSSENESRFAGTTLLTRNVNYQITKKTGSTAADDVTEFDVRGFTNDNDTFRINPIGTSAQIDCVVIATGRTNMGKMDSGSCVVK